MIHPTDERIYAARTAVLLAIGDMRSTMQNSISPKIRCMCAFAIAALAYTLGTKPYLLKKEEDDGD